MIDKANTQQQLSDNIATIGVIGLGVFITVFTGSMIYGLLLFGTVLFYTSYSKRLESTTTTSSSSSSSSAAPSKSSGTPTTLISNVEEKLKQMVSSANAAIANANASSTSKQTTSSSPMKVTAQLNKSLPQTPPTTSTSTTTSPSTTPNKPLRQVPNPPVPPRPSTTTVSAELAPPLPPRKQPIATEEEETAPPPPPRRSSVPLPNPSPVSSPVKVVPKPASTPATPSTPSTPSTPNVAVTDSPTKSSPFKPTTTTTSSSSTPSSSSPTSEGKSSKAAGMSTLRGLIGGVVKNITGPQISSEEREKNNLKRKNIADEILQTEKVYVGKLKVIVEVFYIPLKTAATENPHPPLTIEQVHSIFSEIVTIYNYNSHFLNSLQDRISKSTSSSTTVLGDIFISITDFLKTYTVYINNYSKSMETLERAKKNQSLVNLLDIFSQNPACDCLGLESMLIMPVQRIPRYILLLTELSKVTDKNSSDFAPLQKALEKMKVLASDMNENRREAELLNRMYEIQNTLDGYHDGDFISPARKLIAEANFQERSVKNGSPKPRDSVSKSSNVHYILCNDILLRTKQKGKKLQLKEVISVNNISFKDIPDEPLAIVSSDGDILLLKSEEDPIEEKWKDLIRNQQKINKDNEISLLQ
ncbi:pleckstrin domain-containing protein [Heterostelium album PN500]|uniref:Pleckstrin domain-containing protein n=1 Tax=Heterostelium pallidum (strain ATCC 26659 / Pp 5 / PN500) TaxID=670386 RepID=D3B2I2_HETP5|nr:pleckstrin domain-containing protein [Heterostelium album PN500]EFA83530.1 pleckstrin domain-containing protein [Heterostelium album PN500]|eukprot:XP_020435647.1 pleckstrin domain-containing protein [Heterostelium album PN500]